MTDDTDWEETTTGAWSYYDNDPSYQKPYGKLYNYYAASDSRNVCPTGYRVASKEDWASLVNYLDPNSLVTFDYDITLSDIAGGDLKTTGETYWEAPNEGATDKINFSAVASGDRDRWGSYDAINGCGNWWTSSINSNDKGLYIGITYYDTDVYIDEFNSNYGFSIRCIKN